MKREKVNSMKMVSLFIATAFLFSTILMTPGYAANGTITLTSITRTAPASIQVGKTIDVNYTITPKAIPVPAAKPIDIVLVLDTSLSMDSNSRLTAAKTSMKNFVDTLAGIDNVTVSLVDFNLSAISSTTYTNVGTNSTTRASVKTKIDTFTTNRGTNTGDGLRAAYSLLKDVGSTHDRYIILLTDGLTNGFSYTKGYTLPNSSTNFDSTKFYVGTTNNSANPTGGSSSYIYKNYYSGSQYYITWTGSNDDFSMTNDNYKWGLKYAMKIAGGYIKPAGIKLFLVGYGTDNIDSNIGIAQAAGTTYDRATSQTQLNSLYSSYSNSITKPAGTVHFEETVPSGLDYVSCDNSNLTYSNDKITGDINVSYTLSNGQYTASPINIKITYRAKTVGTSTFKTGTADPNASFAKLSLTNYDQQTETLAFDALSVTVTPLLAPTITTPSQTTSSSSITIAGTAEANAVVKIFDNNVSMGTTTATSNGTFNMPINLTLNANNVIYAVETETYYNNVSTSSNSITITQDSIAPTLNPVSITSSNANSNFAKVGDTVTLAFKSDETLLVTPTVYIAGHLLTPIKGTGNSYTAQYTMISSDTEGTVSFAIYCYDLLGNKTACTATTDGSSVIFDKTAPIITLKGNNPENVIVNNTYTDAGATVTDNYSKSLTATVSGTVNTTRVGTYILTYNALDEAGNEATPVTRTVHVTYENGEVVTDNESPTITLAQDIPNTTKTTHPVTVAVNVSDTGGSGVDESSIYYIVNGNSSNHNYLGSENATISVTQNETITVYAKDKAGNSADPTSIQITNIGCFSDPNIKINPTAGDKNDNVTVEITHTSPFVLEYKIDNSSWNVCSGVIQVSAGKTIYTREVDYSVEGSPVIHEGGSKQINKVLNVETPTSIKQGSYVLLNITVNSSVGTDCSYLIFETETSSITVEGVPNSYTSLGNGKYTLTYKITAIKAGFNGIVKIKVVGAESIYIPVKVQTISTKGIM